MESLILRDRNHPSVIIWSLCNEALCEGFDQNSAQVLMSRVRQLDPDGGRPISAAVNVQPSGFDDILDVMGINYMCEWTGHTEHSPPCACEAGFADRRPRS